MVYGCDLMIWMLPLGFCVTLEEFGGVHNRIC